MKKKVFIIGIGEFAQIAYEYFTFDSDFEVVGFCVNQEYILQSELFGLPVAAYEDVEATYNKENVHAFVGIPASDMNRTRTRFYRELKSKGYQFATYISSQAFVWRNAVIGENTFIFENNTVQPFVSIGNNCILWSGNHIGHRTVVQDNCFIASHAVISGYCEIGAGSFVGVNATVNDNIKIAENCLIGSGALIVKDTDSERIYVGSPARAVPNKSSFDAGI